MRWPTESEVIRRRAARARHLGPGDRLAILAGLIDAASLLIADSPEGDRRVMLWRRERTRRHEELRETIREMHDRAAHPVP